MFRIRIQNLFIDLAPDCFRDYIGWWQKKQKPQSQFNLIFSGKTIWNKDYYYYNDGKIANATNQIPSYLYQSRFLLPFFVGVNGNQIGPPILRNRKLDFLAGNRWLCCCRCRCRCSLIDGNQTRRSAFGGRYILEHNIGWVQGRLVQLLKRYRRFWIMILK